MPKAEGKEVDNYNRTLARTIVNEQIHITEKHGDWPLCKITVPLTHGDRYNY